MRERTLYVCAEKSKPLHHEPRSFVNRLNDTVLPRATAGTGIHTYVGGPNAGNVDFANLVGHRRPNKDERQDYQRHCCVGRSRMARDWSGDCTSDALGLGRLPVPAGGDHHRSPLVSAVRAVLPRCRGTAGRARRHRRSRQRLPMGAALHPGVHPGRPAVPSRSWRPVVRR